MLKSCAVCGAEFDSQRPAGKYCGDTCRKRAQRQPKLKETSAPPSSGGGVEAATLAELQAAGRVDSAVGQAVLVLARRLDAAYRETGAAVASLTREYRATLDAAVQSAQEAADPLDELRLRRERKLHAG